MKLKSLLLGSAAALAIGGVAHAADVVAPMAPAPEPVNYVKVCDAYGSGFFYIPGTDTCLSINGYVWYQAMATSQGAGDTPGYYGSLNQDGWRSGTRARINLDARSQTEWGTLRGWIRLQADNDGSKVGDPTFGLDQAWVQLGGFAAGYGESAWFYQFNSSAANYGSFSWGGLYYGYQERDQIRYEFGGKNGFYGLVSLEEPADESTYAADVVGRIGYSAPWGDLRLTGAYDHDRNGILAGDDGALALAGTLLFNVPSMPGSAVKIIGYYNSADSNYGPGDPLDGVAGFGQPEWSVLASYNAQLNPNLALIVSGQYFGDLYYAGTDNKSNTNAWAGELSAVWLPVKNFEIRPEVVYTKADGYDGTVSGYLRFTRYF